VYYALKAVETDKTELTQWYNAIIANINDQSWFTPAGMETANKAVCAKILQEMDVETDLFSIVLGIMFDLFSFVLGITFVTTRPCTV